MAAEYQQFLDRDTGEISSDGIRRTADGAYIPNHDGNSDWGAYQAWLAEGNVPDPPEPLPEPPPPAPLTLDAHPTDDMHATTKAYVDHLATPITERIEALEARLAQLDRRT